MEGAGGFSCLVASASSNIRLNMAEKPGYPSGPDYRPNLAGPDVASAASALSA